MEYMDWENFDMLISPVINNPLPLYDFMREGHNVNIHEVFIALVFFCYKAHYNDRIQLVFNVFDLDHGGTLDRKEASKLVQATIFGLSKLAGLPTPVKSRVTEYIQNTY